MAGQVITIGRQCGSGGHTIGKGFAENYHLCLDSSLIGIEKCVSVICDIYQSINAGQ